VDIAVLRGVATLASSSVRSPERKTTMKLLWLIGLFAMSFSPLQAHERKDITVTQLLSSTMTSSGQPIVLPQKDAQIVVSIHDAMPGATLRAHNHPYPRYVYVLSGNLQVNNIETGQTDTYKPGSFILESVGEWQTATSIGEEPLKLLVIDIVEKGQSNTVLPN
jgi:quercetin dioxygenase-like cupin family protein